MLATLTLTLRSSFTDVDALWQKDAVGHMRSAARLLSGPGIISSRGSFPVEVARAWGATACTGVFFVSGRLPAQFWAHTFFPPSNDQRRFNELLSRAGVRVDTKLLYEESRTTSLVQVPMFNFTLALLPHHTFPRVCNGTWVTGGLWEENVVVKHCRDGL